MNTEAHVKTAAHQVLTFITRKASETGNTLSDDITAYINDVKSLPWNQAYEKTMPYRILTDQLRLNTIRDKLPFLTEKEAYSVKAYLDFICNFAGMN